MGLFHIYTETKLDRKIECIKVFECFHIYAETEQKNVHKLDLLVGFGSWISIAPDKDWRQLGIYPPLFGLIGYFKF